jgi:hypothetical protein
MHLYPDKHLLGLEDFTSVCCSVHEKFSFKLHKRKLNDIIYLVYKIVQPQKYVCALKCNEILLIIKKLVET